MMIQDSHITTGLHCGICIALWCPELHTIIFDQSVQLAYYQLHTTVLDTLKQSHNQFQLLNSVLVWKFRRNHDKSFIQKQTKNTQSVSNKCSGVQVESRRKWKYSSKVQVTQNMSHMKDESFMCCRNRVWFFLCTYRSVY